MKSGSVVGRFLTKQQEPESQGEESASNLSKSGIESD
jgi:hypothetical protein